MKKFFRLEQIVVRIGRLARCILAKPVLRIIKHRITVKGVYRYPKKT
jgi:hypothetical protein